MATPGNPQSSSQPDLTKRSDIPLVAERDVDRSASMGKLVADATSSMSTMIRGEIELAKAEITQSVKQGAVGAVFFIIAGVVALFSLWFFWFMIAEILSIWLWRWLAFTIVFVAMLLMAAVFGFLGWRKVKKVKAPEHTIAELNQTKQALTGAVKPHNPGGYPAAAPGPVAPLERH